MPSSIETVPFFGSTENVAFSISERLLFKSTPYQSISVLPAMNNFKINFTFSLFTLKENRTTHWQRSASTNKDLYLLLLLQLSFFCCGFSGRWTWTGSLCSIYFNFLSLFCPVHASDYKTKTGLSVDTSFKIIFKPVGLLPAMTRSNL